MNVRIDVKYNIRKNARQNARENATIEYQNRKSDAMPEKNVRKNKYHIYFQMRCLKL
jgi:hypothetical protein